MEHPKQGFELALKNKLTQKVTAGQNEIATLIRYFKHFDVDNDECVTLDQWSKAIEKIGIIVPSSSSLQHIFHFYDTNNTGLINYREFTELLYHPVPLKYVLTISKNI